MLRIEHICCIYCLISVCRDFWALDMHGNHSSGEIAVRNDQTCELMLFYYRVGYNPFLLSGIRKL